MISLSMERNMLLNLERLKIIGFMRYHNLILHMEIFKTYMKITPFRVAWRVDVLSSWYILGQMSWPNVIIAVNEVEYGTDFGEKVGTS